MSPAPVGGLDVDGADIDSILAALADPTRRAIIERLSESEATVTELTEPFDMTSQAISQHVAVLERAGLVTRRRHRQTRPCVLVPEALGLVSSWAEARRAEWEDRHDRLGDYLSRLTEERERGA